ncbi:maleylpyruvate isomerase N-terminal domain-containing protein [Leucobacter ruminantium]|uniref:Maleylpyruvate isomerase N-terminal domain-containing protein n=1 Tax=Leucobacter ruminantium TaxID=1289170 RepID=A0A939M1X2_9MICO|nr:maleylpyruvate isomerase N-terminal domain-containing protein [Leucobacter ruminantium]MBO1805530.1 maleylpyruvate isomerase N-terminal domain-containing protein [Leucobacter ruminantium]
MSSLGETIEVFTAAARWTGELVRDLPEAAWSGPGLGDWDMRALVGHTSRALLTVEEYLRTPADRADAASAAEYYARVGAIPNANPDAVLRRGIDAGAALGADPSPAFEAIVNRVTGSLSGIDDRSITTVVGGMRLSDYLPTRTFELIVHGLDIARASGLPAAPPLPALRSTLELAAGLALDSGTGAELLLAITGRGVLPAGFSVLP